MGQCADMLISEDATGLLLVHFWKLGMVNENGPEEGRW